MVVGISHMRGWFFELDAMLRAGSLGAAKVGRVLERHRCGINQDLDETTVAAVKDFEATGACGVCKHDIRVAVDRAAGRDPVLDGAGAAAASEDGVKPAEPGEAHAVRLRFHKYNDQVPYHIQWRLLGRMIEHGHLPPPTLVLVQPGLRPITHGNRWARQTLNQTGGMGAAVWHTSKLVDVPTDHVEVCRAEMSRTLRLLAEEPAWRNSSFVWLTQEPISDAMRTQIYGDLIRNDRIDAAAAGCVLPLLRRAADPDAPRHSEFPLAGRLRILNTSLIKGIADEQRRLLCEDQIHCPGPVARTLINMAFRLVCGPAG